MTETLEDYCGSKAPKPLHKLNYLYKRVQNWFTALSVECRYYGIGMALVIASGIVIVFKRPEAGFLALVGAFVFALGLLPVIERLYEWAWRTLLGKLLIAALIALATNMAYGFGRQMVSDLVGTSPESFAATVNIATILMSPVLFLMALAIGGVFLFGASLCAGSVATMLFFSSAHPSKGKRAGLWLCRFIALTIAVFGSWSLLKRSDGYMAWVSSRTTSFLYTFDMYRDTAYAKGKDEKIAFLPDGRLLVGSPKQAGYNFEIRKTTDANKSQK
jgi:hypothetical protein